MTNRLLLIPLLLTFLAAPSLGADVVTFKHEGKVQKVVGRVVKEAEGAVLLLAPDGVIWNITSTDVVERKADDQPFKPLPREELAKKLLTELPPGCKVHHTAHYLICYNTSEAYAQWCGALYERLYGAFRGYFKNRGWELAEPEFPLVALVFDDKASYAEYAKTEIGAGAESIVAYFNFGKNRVVMYDLTGVDSEGRVRPRAGKAAKVREILAAPDARMNVATIVHEATHQLAFNCGVHQRYADIPLWVSEGLAIFFETPDFKAKGDGWSTIGAVSDWRLEMFRKSLADRPANALATLLTDDKRFKDPKTALGSYAEAWALNYYLFKKRNNDYVAYLKLLAAKHPGEIDDAQRRLADFQSIFGADLKKLDADFVKSTLAIKVK